MWRDKAACRGADPSIFFEDPSCKEAELFCNECVVRVECLEFALATKSVGFWGGTRSSQRGVVDIRITQDGTTPRTPVTLELRTISFSVTHQGLAKHHSADS